jgi:hypothetical protein
MIKQAYVLEIAARDVEAEARTFTTVLGIPGIPMHADMDTSGAIVARHFTTDGLYAIGVQGLRDPQQPIPRPNRAPEKKEAWMLQQRLAQQGEGAYLLGFLVDELDRHSAELRRQGIRFTTDAPVRHMVGRNITVEPSTTFGAGILYTEHDPDAYARWIATDPARAPHEVHRSSRRVYAIHVAVHDLGAAVAVFSRLLQKQGVPMQPEMDAGGDIVGVHFAVGGVQSLGLVALRDPTRRYPPPNIAPGRVGPWLLQRHLDTAGEGMFLLGLLVDDLDAHVATLRQGGVKFLLGEPLRYAVGRNNFIDPTTMHGVTVMLAQHDPEAYERWRSRWAI